MLPGMGWMRTLLLGDIGNRLDIADAEDSINLLVDHQRQTASKLKTKDLRIDQMIAELARQKLAIQAPTRFLVHKEIVSEEELNDFIQEVDAEDGVLDGKMTLDHDKVRLRFQT